MKGVLQRSFFPILILIVLVGSAAIANEIMNKRSDAGPNVDYMGQKVIVTPEDLNGTGYVPDEVVVGFWRMPPSLEEFGAKYGGTLINSSVDDELKFATFNTSDMTGFINKVASDPYVSSAEPNVIFSIGSYPNFS